MNEFHSNVIEPGRPSLPPLLTEPLSHYAELPGNWHYMHMSKPGWLPSCCTGDCTCDDCECGMEIITGSTNSKEDRRQRYFRLFLNGCQRVEALECLSRDVSINIVIGSYPSTLIEIVYVDINIAAIAAIY